MNEVRAQGGEIIGLTSAPQKQVDVASREWKINFPLVSDPSCELVSAMNRNGWITSVIKMDDSVTTDSFFTQQVGMTYSTGMLQPGVVALAGDVDVYKSSCQGVGIDPSVLVSWGSVPSAANINGASGRLHPKTTWKIVQASLTGDYSLAVPSKEQIPNPNVHPYLLFLLLMANGNFVFPKTMTNDVKTGLGSAGKLRGTAMKVFLAAATLGIGVATQPVPTSAFLALYAVYFSFGGPLTFLNEAISTEGTSKL